MLTLRNFLAGTAFAICAGALAACNGGTTYTGPTPGPTCAPPATAYQLVYPAPGATAVPVTTQMMVVALNAQLPNYTWDLALKYSGGTALTANTLAPIAASQLPPGSGTTTIPNPVYEEVQLIAQLPSAVTLTVGLNNLATNCTPLYIPGATFTTQ
jgi:hypothetical protein